MFTSGINGPVTGGKTWILVERITVLNGRFKVQDKAENRSGLEAGRIKCKLVCYGKVCDKQVTIKEIGRG